MTRELSDEIHRLMPSVRSDLDRLVRIASVRGQAVRDSAYLTAALFRAAGGTVEILAVPGGAPAVIATFPGPPNTPTVLLYAHHDVQPAGDKAAWNTSPFDPVEKDGRLYGRGTADDKAGIAAHLAAVRAYGGRPPVGVTVFVEGEEEVGSPTLAAFLAQHRGRLAADVIVLADGDNWGIGQPALTVGLRGLVDCRITVRTLAANVHSGAFGGVAPDALTALCRLLATLHNDRGEVTVQGIGRGGVANVPISDDRIRLESGMLAGVASIGHGPLSDRLWNQPALAVLAIDSPSTAEAPNALQASARAKVSLRIPPGSDPADAYASLRQHVLGNVPWGVDVSIEPGQLVQPYAIDTTGAGYDAARAAFTTAWGVPPVEIGSGGSIPLVAPFAEAFPHAALLITGLADPQSNPHAPNESLHLGDFTKACLAEALLLRHLADG
ncbi:dipeptidase [Kribbella sp. NPDC058245]|uniref:dipeptidase n=1 Tax=Kribbella sp. NPDC058245 TaxID=3346399 RepID=UPI0036EAF8CC